MLSLDDLHGLNVQGKDWLSITETLEDDDGKTTHRTLCKLLVGSSMSPDYSATNAYLSRHFQAITESSNIGGRAFNVNEDHTASMRRLDEMQRENVARHLVFDWSGLEQGGKEVPFDSALCVRLFEKRPDIYYAVIEKAVEIAARAERQKEETVGKSEPSSSTTRKTRTRRSAAGSSRS